MHTFDQPKGLVLDRYPNRDGNYEKGNCRWATWVQSAINMDRADYAVGVRKHGNGFRAVIERNGHRYRLPGFETFEAAVAARRVLKEKLDAEIG